MAESPEVETLATACDGLLGSDLRTPPGYPDSLALCILDGVWSMGVRYRSVENVLGQYRRWLSEVAGDDDPFIRGASQLAADIALAGGPDRFAEDVLCNRARTSSRSGILKAEAVQRAAAALLGLGVDTAADFRGRYDDPAVEGAWRAVKGQRSGISWHYLRILAGVQDVKADRMICGFIADALGLRVDPVEARRLVIAAHERLQSDRPELDLRTLDHAIWTHQRAGR